MRKVRTWIVATTVFGLLVFLWRAYDLREPSYLGQPISYWVEPWHHHGSESLEREAAAFAAMDDRAVRWLARRLDWTPSRLKEGLARMINRLGDFTSDRDYDDGRRAAAVRALTRLGPRAKAAIPELEALSHTNVELQRDQLRLAATAALVRIREESLQPFIEKLPTASGEEWGGLATILGLQGTNAADAVPLLVAGLLQTNRFIWVEPTVIALGNIHSYPELSVPALLQQFGKTNLVREYYVITALGSFGPAAKAARNDLAARLATTPTNSYEMQVLRTALKQIDATNFETPPPVSR